MLMLDECHLRWGDACGYAWGPMDQRLTIPISNVRERQTYYGALNLLTGRVTLWEAGAGNAENTVAFLTYLRQCFQGRRLLICWDGARYLRPSSCRTIWRPSRALTVRNRSATFTSFDLPHMPRSKTRLKMSGWPENAPSGAHGFNSQPLRMRKPSFPTRLRISSLSRKSSIGMVGIR